MNTAFWLYKPSNLINKEHITKLFPEKNMTSNEKLNAITRLVIILTVLGYLITQKYKIIITGLITIVSIVFLFIIQRNEEVKKGVIDIKEAFTNMNVYDEKKSNFTQPTVANPVMNVLMTEYKDNPKRMAAAPSYFPDVSKSINENTKQFIKNNFGDSTIDEKLFNDLGDSFEFNQSMRSWYVTPNTRIPNEQDEFVKYCYGNMKSCKDGDDFACTTTTASRWTNQ
jgi:hypothetical protein